MGSGIVGPFFAVFTEEIGGNILDISWAWALYLVVNGILTIIIGRLSDHTSKEKLMVLGYYLNALFTFSYLFVQSTWSLLIVQAGLGFALALAEPTWEALYAKYETKKADGFAWGLVSGMANINTALAILLAGFIINYFSFQTLFIVMATIQLIAAIYQTQSLFIKR